jgi:hypothetical protein
MLASAHLTNSKKQEQNIILNDVKKEIGLKEITFHGHKITSHGVKIDDKKVNFL